MQQSRNRHTALSFLLLGAFTVKRVMSRPCFRGHEFAGVAVSILFQMKSPAVASPPPCLSSLGLLQSHVKSLSALRHEAPLLSVDRLPIPEQNFNLNVSIVERRRYLAQSFQPNYLIRFNSTDFQRTITIFS
jgi:hypothetical protein